MSKNYQFDGQLSKEVLENYLSRSVTAQGLHESETLTDDLRVIKKLGIKFLGRASGLWYMTNDDEEHFRRSKEVADLVHEMDTEIILQSAVFEIIVEKINEIRVPAFVFEAFGLEVKNRNFCFTDALFLEKPKGFIFTSNEKEKNGGIPDLNRLEARMWFYYRAARYIDCGYEALHMGQVHLYTANDKGMKKTKELFEMIRDYAKINGRRHKILLDAHTHGVNIGGDLLFDYHAMPYTRVPLMDRGGKELVLVREGYSEGGKNPNGFRAPVMPYLMEYDNWGGKVVDNPESLTREELAAKDWWGYDQIGWFANQDMEARNHILEYTYKWTEVNNKNAYFQVPLRRMLSDAAVSMKVYNQEEMATQPCYQLNNQNKNCPLGFCQEDQVLKLWSKNHKLRQMAGNPSDLLDYGAKEVYDSETGLKLPEKIVVYGSFQPQVGAVQNDSNSETTRMYYIGDNTYSLTVIMPYAGTYDFAISTYGTLSATYCYDIYPRSGSSNKGYFTTTKDNLAVRFLYQFISNKVLVEVIED